MAQMKEQIKAPEKIQLSNEEKANLSDAWFKTLLIRMLTDGWVWSQKRGKSEGYEKSNKEQCTGKETGTPMNGLDQKEEINIQPDRMKKQEFRKIRRGLGTSRTILNVPTSES